MYAITVVLLEDIKDESRLYQESARLCCEFYFKIKNNTELNKLIFIKNENLTYNYQMHKKTCKDHSFVRNKELMK